MLAVEIVGGFLIRTIPQSVSIIVGRPPRDNPAQMFWSVLLSNLRGVLDSPIVKRMTAAAATPAVKRSPTTTNNRIYSSRGGRETGTCAM